MTREWRSGDAITLRCLHCGPVTVSDPSFVRATMDIVDALAQGHAPLGAMTCPKCNGEVRARDVIRDVDPWLADMGAQ